MRPLPRKAESYGLPRAPCAPCICYCYGLGPDSLPGHDDIIAAFADRQTKPLVQQCGEPVNVVGLEAPAYAHLAGPALDDKTPAIVAVELLGHLGQRLLVEYQKAVAPAEITGNALRGPG